jgi:hypothetical protein
VPPRRDCPGAVAQVADKHQAAPVRVLSGIVIAQHAQQGAQRLVLAVDVAHDVERGAG